MKKILFIAIVCCLPLFAYSQTAEAEKDLYIYNVVKLSGNLEKHRFKVRLDNGKNYKKMKDTDGRKIKFRTPAALLTYLASEGWELYVNGSNILGNHYEHKKKGHKSESSWIIRKQCTQEELDQFLQANVKRRRKAANAEETTVETETVEVTEATEVVEDNSAI